MNEFSLPPNVFGKTKSNLSLTIENIVWKTSKVFNEVKIIIKWWGDSNGQSISGIKVERNLKNKNPLKSVQYQVKTNHKLFQAYLSNCEPIVIEIYSVKTQDFIGSAKIEIPVKFLCIREGQEQSFRKTARIFSCRQFNLGDLEIILKYSPLEMTQKTSSRVETKKIRTKSQDRQNAKDSNKENIQVIGAKKKISTREPIPVKATTLIRKKVDKNPIVDYLSGASMSNVAQKNALNALSSQSPANDLIKSIATTKLDILCSTINKIEFNALGQMQIQNFITYNQGGKFVIKCVAKSRIFGASEDFKVLSSVFESTPSSK